jgi:hypothetical protein
MMTNNRKNHLQSSAPHEWQFHDIDTQSITPSLSLSACPGQGSGDCWQARQEPCILCLWLMAKESALVGGPGGPREVRISLAVSLLFPASLVGTLC